MELKHSFDIAVENIVNSVRTVDDETPLGKVCAIIQLETFVLLKSSMSFIRLIKNKFCASVIMLIIFQQQIKVLERRQKQ